MLTENNLKQQMKTQKYINVRVELTFKTKSLDFKENLVYIKLAEKQHQQ